MSLVSFVGFVIFREMMLISHQKSIEQLRETLRQKLLNDDNWREKVTVYDSHQRVSCLFF